MMDCLYFILLVIMISIASYNSRGLGPGKLDYIGKMCHDNEFVFIQEHWQLTDNLAIFQDRIPNISCHGVSAIDSSQILHGRPHGGCSILWNSDLSCKVTPIDACNNRVCAIIADFIDVKLLLITCYLPCDTKYDRQNLAEYSDALGAAAAVAKQHGVDLVVYGGDFNTDFKRSNSLHTMELNRFISEEIVFEPVNGIDYTFESMSSNDRSTIDHFLITENLRQFVVDYVVIHDGDNLSDHSPIRLTLSIEPNFVNPIDSNHKSRKLCWRDATADSIEVYQRRLSHSLCDVSIPFDSVYCVDPNCTNHCDQIAEYCSDLIDCLIDSGDKSIPKCKQSGTRVPGWNEYVRPAREASIFWHSIWKQCGSPGTGWVSQIRRHARGEYHRAVRNLQRQRNSVTANKMANSLNSNNSRDLWSECKKINSISKPSPSNVDGTTGDANISSVFANNYERLYNSVSYDCSEMSELQSDIDSRVHDLCCNSSCNCNHFVSIADLQGALQLLKSGKSDGTLSTDHIIHASSDLLVHLSLLFTCMIRHGYSPSPFLKSTIIPIPKNVRKSLNDSNNYRGIALNSPLSKLFELVILYVHRDTLSTSDLQFGYKKGLSTNSCTFVANEVIQEYLNGDNDVHVMLLDASKAFDCVNYVTLFRQLIHKGICPLICRVLLYMHISQTVQVRWNSSLSDPFSVSNGVKQGGILSPVLFSIYTDYLLCSLRDSGVGCHLGHVFAGALAYADDIVLLAPSKSALTRMLDVASSCADRLCLEFNGAKSQYLRYCTGHESCGNNGLTFCGVDVPRITEGLHLGNVLSSNKSFDFVSSLATDLVIRTNVLMSRFSFCSPEVRYKLFKSYCVVAYGSQLWDFDSLYVQKYFTTWRKCVRKIWGLSNLTHSYLLPEICVDSPIELQLLSRTVNFVRSAANSQNILLNLSCQRALRGSQSRVSNSIAHICDRYDITRDSLCYERCGLPGATVPSTCARAGAIREFAIALHYAGGEDREALNSILIDLCTN